MFYVFHGDDEHSQREFLADLESKLGDPSMLELNTSKFDGHSLSLSLLQHTCDSIPFLADRRLVIVDNLFVTDPPYLEELLIYLPALPESTRLVFMESHELGKKHPILKAVRDNEKGHVRLFTRPTGNSLEAWIRQRVKSAGGQISHRAVHMLAINVGNDLELLDNEIEKLILYKGSLSIDVDDVTLLCPFVAESSIFELVDAIGSRHGQSAAQLLQNKLNEGTDPFYLFAMIIRQFRLLIQVKELAKNGATPAEISKSLKIHSFVAGKILQQSHNFSFAQLEQIYERLLEIDIQVKTGQTDLTTALCLLVAGISV